MAESTVVKTKRDVVVAFSDGAATPLTYTCSYEPGSSRFHWPKAASIKIDDRGDIAGQRKGAQEIGSFGIRLRFREFTSGSDATPFNVILKTGAWSAATSTGGTGYEDFMHKVSITVEGSDHGDSADHVANLGKVKLDIAGWDESGEDIMIDVTGEVWEAPTYTGPA